MGRVAAGVFVVLGALFAGWGAAAGIAERDAAGAVVVAAMGIGTSLLAYRSGFHPSLTADERGLVVRNPFSTRVIPWSEFKQAQPGYMGIVISRVDGSTAVAWVVQKSNWAMAKGTPTRADQVIAEIAAIAERETGASRREFELNEVERKEAQESKRRYLWVALPVLVGSFVLRLVLDSMN